MFHEEALIDEIGNLRKFALRLTKNGHDADDLVQSTLLRAMEKKDYFQNGTNLFSWTSKIMFNLFVSSYRQKKKFETRYDPAPHIEQVAIGPSQEATTDLVTVGEYISNLSAEHRDILLLVCVKGLSYEDASTSLGIPVGTVRSRLSRARRQLQDMLGSHDRPPMALPHYMQAAQQWAAGQAAAA
jgi:RNA polymerase sigma-70 factor (ECF subfamily)